MRTINIRFFREKSNICGDVLYCQRREVARASRLRLDGDGGEFHRTVRLVFFHCLLPVDGEFAAGKQWDADKRRRVGKLRGLQIQIAFRDDFRLCRRQQLLGEIDERLDGDFIDDI